MPKTKIICTIGPACDSPELIKKLIAEGMNVARLNFSHGTHDEHRDKIKTIRETSKEMGKHVAILQDLCGPKIRVGKVVDAGITLIPGEEFILSTDDFMGEGKRVSVSFKNLPSDVNEGDIILLADGMMELVVKETNSTEVKCKVITGGTLTSNKGINLPSGTISAPCLTEKDKDDLKLGLENDVDYIALSFVRNEADIKELRDIIEGAGKDIPIVAKIEKHEAIARMDEIVATTDAIMVARGDLGVEIPLEDVPGVQKELISKANAAGKPVIVATQMLRSMVDSPRPTRAEANDVANAVIDGADAVMLSEETASGTYPVKAVHYMSRIADSAEGNYPHEKYMTLDPASEIPESVAYASCVLADHLKASAIVASTRTGFTAKQISRYRPGCIIIALSPDEKVVRRLSLYWGMMPSLIADAKDTDEMIDQGAEAAQKTGLVSEGDRIVITAGHPVWVEGTTNMVKVKTI